MDVYIYRSGNTELRRPLALPPGERWYREAVMGPIQMAEGDTPDRGPSSWTRDWFLAARVHNVQVFEETR